MTPTLLTAAPNAYSRQEHLDGITHEFVCHIADLEQWAYLARCMVATLEVNCMEEGVLTERGCTYKQDEDGVANLVSILDHLQREILERNITIHQLRNALHVSNLQLECARRGLSENHKSSKPAQG